MQNPNFCKDLVFLIFITVVLTVVFFPHHILETIHIDGISSIVLFYFSRVLNIYLVLGKSSIKLRQRLDMAIPAYGFVNN